jgi:hypothetical protein
MPGDWKFPGCRENFKPVGAGRSVRLDRRFARRRPVAMA